MRDAADTLESFALVMLLAIPMLIAMVGFAAWRVAGRILGRR